MKISSVLYYAQHPIHALGKVVDSIHRRFHPDNPWITHQSVKYLENLLNDKQHIGLEWGSGKSTLWFSHFCKELHSIEYDKQWYEVVLTILKKNNVNNTTLLYIPLEHSKSEPTYPTYEKLPEYVRKIEDYTDNYFSFILVDGHYRQACVIASDKKLKSGGYLIIDNYNRVKSPKEWGVPETYKLIHVSSNIVTTTAVFEKP